MLFNSAQTVGLGVSNGGTSISVGSPTGKNGSSVDIPAEATVMSVTLSKPFRLVNVFWLAVPGSSGGTAVSTNAGVDVVAVLTNGVYVVTLAPAPYNIGTGGNFYFSNLRIALTSDLAASGTIQVGMPV
jgi:hypothetical protein